MKHTFKLLITIVLFSVLITACGNEAPTETGQTNNVQDEMKMNMDQLDFHEFELEVSYENDKEYEADLKTENNRIEAKIEDELNNINMNGKEAFDELYPNIKQLSLSSNSSDQEVIEQILNTFDLPDNYEKFDVEIDFNDNSKLEVEHSQ